MRDYHPSPMTAAEVRQRYIHPLIRRSHARLPPEPMTAAEVRQRFDYRAFNDEEVIRQRAVVAAIVDAAMLVLAHTPPSRSQALALTKLEEAAMHVGKAIAWGER